MNKKLLFVALPIIAIFLAIGLANRDTNLGASVLRVTQGGTGAATFTAGKCLYGNGTDAIYADDCAEGSMVYPGAGIAISSGSGWATSTADNSANWNTAYGWGDHSTEGYLTVASAESDPVWIASSTDYLKTATALTLFDVLGQATSTLASHTSTYNHANYDTAYGWGNHASSGYLTASTTQITASGNIWAGGFVGNVTGTASGNLISGGTLTTNYHCRYDGTGIDCDRVEDASGACATNAVCMGGHTHPGVNETYGAGWDSDTATPEKDDVYDWGVKFDTDSDGLVNNLDTNAIDDITEIAAALKDGSGDCSSGLICLGDHTHSSYLTAVASDSTWTTHDSYPSACSAGQFVTAIGDTLTCDTPASEGGWTFATTTLDYWFDNTTGIARLLPYVTQAYASSTYAIAGGAHHDGFSDFVANEHIDWTGASAGTIHATNYVDNNTTYTAGGTLLNLAGTTFSVNEGTLTTGKACIYTAGTGIVCNTTLTTGTVTSVAMTVPTGLSISGSPITGAGTLALSLTAGYNIPLTASTTNWNTAYDWGNHASGGYLTTVASDSTWTAHNSYPAACSAGQYVSQIGDTLTCGTPTDTNTTYTGGTNLTLSGTTFNVDDSFLLNTGDVGTGNYDFGGASFLEIPNGTNPTANDPGELAHDTTDNQLILDDRVIRTDGLIGSVTIASSSLFFSNVDLPVPPEKDGYTVTRISCYVTGGTSVQVTLTDGTNAMDTLTCGTSITADDGSIANSSVSANELMKLDPGTVSGAVNFVSFSWYGTWTRE